MNKELWIAIVSVLLIAYCMPLFIIPLFVIGYLFDKLYPIKPNKLNESHKSKELKEESNTNSTASFVYLLGSLGSVRRNDKKYLDIFSSKELAKESIDRDLYLLWNNNYKFTKIKL